MKRMKCILCFLETFKLLSQCFFKKKIFCMSTLLELEETKCSNSVRTTMLLIVKDLYLFLAPSLNLFPLFTSATTASQRTQG